MKTLFRIVLVLVALWFGGLIRFVGDIQTMRQTNVAADAIVVLTGSQGRVTEGLELLARDPSRRMLISGVDTRTDKAALARAYPDSAALITCCVTLGPDAKDTVGNAEEIARWAIREGVRSLIVVTAAYHMPRSLVELKRTTASFRLEPWPTRTGTDDPDRWSEDRRTFLRLVVEYHKYVFSLLRARLTEDIGDVRLR